MAYHGDYDGRQSSVYAQGRRLRPQVLAEFRPLDRVPGRQAEDGDLLVLEFPGADEDRTRSARCR